MRRSNLTIELFAHPCIDISCDIPPRKKRRKETGEKKNNRKIVYLRLRGSKETSRRIPKCTLKWKYTFSGGVFSVLAAENTNNGDIFKDPSVTMEAAFRLANAHTVFLHHCGTILVRSSFKGTRISKIIHTLKCWNLATTMPIFPSFLFGAQHLGHV